MNLAQFLISLLLANEREEVLEDWPKLSAAKGGKRRLSSSKGRVQVC